MSEGPAGDIWPAVDEHDEQVREVYARYGLAMYMVQVLEHAMVNAALVMKFLPTMREDSSRETWQVAFDKFWRVSPSHT